MPTKRKPTISPENKSVSINGDVRDSNVIIGDNNVVTKTTIIQKFFNIFKSDAETLEQRNRRILLGHVENAWIKGVLDASLHGAALLDLGIKQDPEAVTQYPWAIKKESTDETLPTGLSMLDIFDSIGMGRSLLILGAPGSGKTTMLLELARQLIARAREDVTQPIPMVFNLASWTEKLTLADWLAQELNNLYSVPRKTAPDWVKGNKLLLLLDGLDEVRQESRAKCVEAINDFRKEEVDDLASLVVCSRSQDYAELNTKLSFEGAIEVQPLTQEQIAEFFNRFGEEMAGIKQAIEKDSSLREMAETPLFLSIMLMAYRDKQDVEILASGDEKARRNHLFETYIQRMFERRLEYGIFKKQDVLHWLSWLAHKMIKHNQIPYLLEYMQPNWLREDYLRVQYEGMQYFLSIMLITGLGGGLAFGWFFGMLLEMALGPGGRLIFGWFLGIMFGSTFMGIAIINEEIFTTDSLSWNWPKARNNMIFILRSGIVLFPLLGLIIWLFLGLTDSLSLSNRYLLLIFLLGVALFLWLIFLLEGLRGGLSVQQLDQTTYPGQRLAFTAKNSIFVFLTSFLPFGLIGVLFGGLTFGLIGGLIGGLIAGLTFTLFFGLFDNNLRSGEWLIFYGGFAIIQHYILRLILAINNHIPWRLIPFLDHCVDLIFLRRVGGGYIFIHRLLMEHFAEMYVEVPTSKGN